jgi:hypothetical protein
VKDVGRNAGANEQRPQEAARHDDGFRAPVPAEIACRANDRTRPSADETARPLMHRRHDRGVEPAGRDPPGDQRIDHDDIGAEGRTARVDRVLDRPDVDLNAEARGAIRHPPVVQRPTGERVRIAGRENHGIHGASRFSGQNSWLAAAAARSPSCTAEGPAGPPPMTSAPTISVTRDSFPALGRRNHPEMLSGGSAEADGTVCDRGSGN